MTRSGGLAGGREAGAELELRDVTRSGGLAGGRETGAELELTSMTAELEVELWHAA